MKHILPFEVDVPSITYHNKAFPLGVIKANIPQFDIWICNKLINCVYESCKNACNLYDEDIWDLKNNLIIPQSFHIIPEIFQCPSFDIISIAKDMINHGYYIYGLYNELYIQGKSAYHNYDFVHDYLIYGYDDDIKSFKSVGYLKNQKYKRYNINYDDFHNSLKHFCFSRLSIHFHKINFNFQPQINISLITNAINDYLLSQQNSSNIKTDDIYGINVWHKLAEQILTTSNSALDIRSFRAFVEHKAIMHLRFKILSSDYVSTELSEAYYTQVYTETEMVYNLSLKYNITHDENLLLKINTYIQKICQAEQKILEKILLQLKD